MCYNVHCTGIWYCVHDYATVYDNIFRCTEVLTAYSFIQNCTDILQGGPEHGTDMLQCTGIFLGVQVNGTVYIIKNL